MPEAPAALFRDLRSAARSLAATPGTTLAAVAAIALGTGACLAVFAVTRATLLAPLPYPEPDRLVILSVEAPDGTDFGVPAAEVERWRERLRTVEGLAAYRRAELPVRGTGEPRLLEVAEVTPGFFDLLGGAPGAVDAAASARLARQAGGELVGCGVTVGGRALAVAAVLPPGFAFPAESTDLWLPAAPAEDGDTRSFRMIARLAPGASVEQARQDAVRVMRELRGPEAATAGAARPTVVPVEEALLGDLRPAAAAALGGGLLVLLVTCGNLALLLLGRSVPALSEAAVRRALGAGAWHLARGPLVQSLLLAASGTAAGLALAQMAVWSFRGTAAGVVPRSGEAAVGLPVLAVAVGAVLLVAVAAGAAPALAAVGRDPALALRRAVGGGRGGRRGLALLVAAQIAVSVVLVAGAALLVQTVDRLMEEDAGFDPSGVLVARLSLDGSLGESPHGWQVLDRVRALPGVRRAGIGSGVPPAGLPFQIYVRFVSETRDEGLKLSAVAATPGYLEALGARRVAGRLLEEVDETPSRPGVVLSESVARLVAAGRGWEVDGLIGRELPFALPPVARFAAPPRVVGVVADVKYDGLDRPAAAAIYLPWHAAPAATAYLLADTDGDPAALAPAVRRILRQAGPGVPVAEVLPLTDGMARSIADRRLRLVPAVGFAGAALAVALSGLFALLLRVAAQRRRELAIRVALGASRSQLSRWLLGRAAVWTGAGVAAGLAATVVATRGLASLLYGVEPDDLPTLAGAVLLVTVAALAASWLPARRAAAIEPASLLREE